MLALLVVVLLAVFAIAGAMGLTPTQAIFERMLILLGGDTATFNKTGGELNKLMLVKAPFTPGEGLTIGALTEATFAGYAAIECESGGAPQSIDPATGDSLLTIEGAGASFLWETTSGSGLPETIYGYALVNNAKDALLGADLLPGGPIVLSAVNQSIRVLLPQMRQLSGSVV